MTALRVSSDVGAPYRDSAAINGQSVTLACWAKYVSVIQAPTRAQYVVSAHRGGAPQARIRGGISGAGKPELISFDASIALDVAVEDTTVLRNAAWYYFAISGQGSGANDAKLRVLDAGGNLVCALSAQGPSAYTLGRSVFGGIGGNSGDSSWADCDLMFMRVWNSVLTPTQIDAEARSTVPVVAAWAAYYDSATDLSGNARTLTLSASATEDSPSSYPPLLDVDHVQPFYYRLGIT